MSVVKWVESVLPESKRFLFLFLFALSVFLTSCDSRIPMGVRWMGIVQQRYDPKTVLVAIIHIWGPGDSHYYKSTDGGFTWEKTRVYASSYPFFHSVNLIEGDCDYSCKFIDPINDQIYYKILKGKILERSFDGGKTWREELEIPEWNRMERNYAKIKFSTTGSTPTDVRGPFSAITDPVTGNLVIAMGYEGILVGSVDNQWTWVEIEGFERLQPTRHEMLGLIHPQEWMRPVTFALLIALLGVLEVNGISFRLGKKTLIFLGAGLIIFLINGCILILFLLVTSTEGKYEASALYISHTVFSAILVILIFRNIKEAWNTSYSLVLKLAGISLLSISGYYLVFIFWSQGIIFSEYGNATLSGLTIFVAAFITSHFVVKNKKANNINSKSE